METAELIKMLPEEKQLYFNDLVKQAIREWDPNFTKVTAKEKELLDKSDEEMKNGEYISEEDFWK